MPKSGAKARPFNRTNKKLSKSKNKKVRGVALGNEAAKQLIRNSSAKHGSRIATQLKQRESTKNTAGKAIKRKTKSAARKRVLKGRK